MMLDNDTAFFITNIFDELLKIRAAKNIVQKYALFQEIEQLKISDKQARALLQNASVLKIHPQLVSEYLQTVAAIEKHTATKLLSQELNLQLFPKYQHFVKRADLEFQLLLKHFSKTQTLNICFIGSGSLPLTAIYFAEKHRAKVTLLDRDLEAIKLSEKLIEKLNLAHLCRFIHADIMQITDFQAYNAIVLANSVGQTLDDKTKIIWHITENINHQQLLMVRLPKGIFCLLNATLPPGFQLSNANISDTHLEQERITMRRLLIRKHL